MWEIFKRKSGLALALLLTKTSMHSDGSTHTSKLHTCQEGSIDNDGLHCRQCPCPSVDHGCPIACRSHSLIPPTAANWCQGWHALAQVHAHALPALSGWPQWLAVLHHQYPQSEPPAHTNRSFVFLMPKATQPGVGVHAVAAVKRMHKTDVAGVVTCQGEMQAA